MKYLKVEFENLECFGCGIIVKDCCVIIPLTEPFRCTKCHKKEIKRLNESS